MDQSAETSQRGSRLVGKSTLIPRWPAFLHWIPLRHCRVSIFQCPLLAQTNRNVDRMKALLFSLVRSFEFELAVPADDIIGSVVCVQSELIEWNATNVTSILSIVTRPTLKSNPGSGGQMPIRIRKINDTHRAL